ncbi:MAG: LD-carboxypeptidase [Clostridia bacterium]|nr:LD-carboxypeptidase [Clostridia bacterium]
MTKKTAALVGCSDPLPEHEIEDVKRLVGVLAKENIEAKVSPLLFSGSRVPAEKAAVLNGFFGDPSVDYIFDVSGGDLANTVLPFLDWDLIRASRAMFFGFSDLTTVINAIIAKTGRPAVNYQIRNLLYDDAENQIKHFREQIIPCSFDVKCLSPVFLRGGRMEGKVFGGNIRCFLKLAGTEFWPDMTGGVLLLESLGGGVYQMVTAIEQYSQLGVFDKINGILLGTFTAMEEKKLSPAIEDIVLRMAPEHIPVAKTRLLGHYPDSRALLLGSQTVFE